MYRLIAVCLMFLLPMSAQGRCGGQDLRDSLSPQDAALFAELTTGVPYASGNHWRASKDGRTIDIVGTMHIADPRLDPVMARLAPIIAGADLLLVEATPAEEKALEAAVAARPELIFLTDGPTLPEMMPEDEWQALSDNLRTRGIPPFMAAKFQPWYLTVLLSIPACAMQDIAAGNRGLDHRIMQAAAAADVPMQALEPFDTLFSIFNRDPLDQQLAMLQLGVISPDLAESGLHTMKQQYFEQNHTGAWEFSRLLSYQSTDLPRAEVDVIFDRLAQAILFERNTNWMPAILNAKGDHIVVAVGAIHLTGPRGILSFLDQAGYTLTRQPF